MDKELDELEVRITRLIDAFTQTCRENRELAARVTRLESENRALSDKLAVAIARIEAVLANLPVTEP